MNTFFSPNHASMEDNSGENQPTNQSSNKENAFGEIVRFALIALLIVIPIRMFIAQPFIVSGASMEDTFHDNEYLIVDQLTYHFEEPKRGDVIIFRYPRDESKFFIKRVIGLPGDTISIDDNRVMIQNSTYPEGIVIFEPYINKMENGSYVTATLDEGEYFVMGDNRDQSSDSRMWGTLDRDEIIGRALLRLFPVSKAGLFPGAYNDKVLSE